MIRKIAFSSLVSMVVVASAAFADVSERSKANYEACADFVAVKANQIESAPMPAGASAETIAKEKSDREASVKWIQNSLAYWKKDFDQEAASKASVAGGKKIPHIPLFLTKSYEPCQELEGYLETDCNTKKSKGPQCAYLPKFLENYDLVKSVRGPIAKRAFQAGKDECAIAKSRSQNYSGMDDVGTNVSRLLREKPTAVQPMEDGHGRLPKKSRTVEESQSSGAIDPTRH